MSDVVLPDWLDSNSWQAWVEYREIIKAPLTPHAARLCIGRLEKLRAEGSDPVEVINNSIMSGKWTGLFATKDEPGVGKPQRRMEDVI